MSKQQEHDPVNPSHYKAGKVECIDAIEAAIIEIKDPVAAYLTGQVIKYMWRWSMKNGVEDLKKAAWYLVRLSLHQGVTVDDGMVGESRS